jgi:hypothetical protein
MGFKDAKKCLRVLACTTASGMLKCKLFVIGKNENFRAFKGMRNFPVHYRANKRAWV